MVETQKKLVSCHKKASVAEQSVTTFNGDGGEHSQSEKRRVVGQRVVKTPKELVSCHKKAGVAEQSITNFNGDGVEHSHPEKRRVEGQIHQKW